MPLPRMTTRRWMVAVAVVAFTFGMGVELNRLWRFREHRLAEYARHQTDAIGSQGWADVFKRDLARKLAEVAKLRKEKEEFCWANAGNASGDTVGSRPRECRTCDEFAYQTI